MDGECQAAEKVVAVDAHGVDFDFKCEIMTKKGSNSGIYIHTDYEETWPTKGYEIQVNCSHTDPVKTGARTGRLDVVGKDDALTITNPPDELRAPVDEWFTVDLVARGLAVDDDANELAGFPSSDVHLVARSERDAAVVEAGVFFAQVLFLLA